MPRNWYDNGEGNPFGHPGQDPTEPGGGAYPGGAPYAPPPPPPAPAAPPAAPTNPTPPPPDLGNFTIPNYNGPYGPTYHFQPPPDFVPPQFGVPTLQDAQNEPGYQFRLQAGQSALDNSAAAKGTLRTGGSLKDLVEYGQNFGAQEYQNVFNRALQGYNTNYTAAKDAYAPRFAQYQNQFQAEQSRAQLEANQHWLAYQAMIDAMLRKEGLAAQVAGS